jgi:hypothetical protein
VAAPDREAGQRGERVAREEAGVLTAADDRAQALLGRSPYR